MIAQLVMPVAEDDVGGNLVDRRRCAVVAGLPLAVTHRSVLEQPVTPHQHRHLLVLDKVRVQVVDRRGKNRRRTLASASRALIAGDQKHLIHADVKGVGFERISQLIDQGKHDAVDLRIQRAPAPAVNPLVVGGDFGRLVELRVLLEQRRRGLLPRLMTQAVELGDQPDSPIATKGGQVTGVVPAQARFLAQLGMRLELEPVIDLQHDDVDSQRLEPFLDSFFQDRNPVFAWRHQMHAPPEGVFGPSSAVIPRQCVSTGNRQDHR